MDFPELVFGLIGSIGTNLEIVQENLEESLKSVGYKILRIKLSDLMRDLSKPWGAIPDRSAPDYYDKAMTAGNRLRKKLKQNDAMAKLAIARIRDLRETSEKKVNGPREKRAYILSSLKRPEEIETLRLIYGSTFFAISAYAPRKERVDRLSKQLAMRQHQNRSNSSRGAAERLILRDESEQDPFGQDVRKTYPLADFFVRSSSISDLKRSVNRFVELVFGNMWHTPSRDEQGMMFATISGLRSASPARQVGAALTNSAGLIISTGMNEVPRSGGGQYWEGDFGDGRDFVYDVVDTSDQMRMNLLTDVLVKLEELKLLRPEAGSVSKILKAGSKSFIALRESQLFDTIDFIRAVHAEMSALLAARGSTDGAILYVTTFPCHECARHIVAAGVKRVVYVEPYPKSLVAELFRDSIEIDAEVETTERVQFVPFTGVAPSVYIRYFRATNKTSRKAKDGTITKWTAAVARPHVPPSYSSKAQSVAETALLLSFTDKLRAEGITNERGSNGRGRRKRVA